MAGSIRSLRSPCSRARVRSSSAPTSLLYPATSAARMAASFRVSAMAAPSLYARLSQLIVQESGRQRRMGFVASDVDRLTLFLEGALYEQSITREGQSTWPNHTSSSSSQLSVVRDFETGGGVNQERVWRIMVDVTRLVCGEATDGFGWSCV